MSSLMPPNQTLFETHMDATIASRFALSMPFETLFNANTCPIAFLPFLAWAHSVDEWNVAWNESVKRDVVLNSRLHHQRKGTVGSLKRFLNRIGYTNHVIYESTSGLQRNGSVNRDGSVFHGDATKWAEYSVEIQQPITTEQANQLRAWLADIAPARSELTSLDFQQVAHLHNGQPIRNGTITRGSV